MDQEELDPEELERIIEASRYVYGNTKLGEPGWIWKNRQLGFERLRSRMHLVQMFDMMFGPNRDDKKAIFDLAIKIIKGGTDFTAEELQLQANEPEALEKMLKEVKEWMSKEDEQ